MPLATMHVLEGQYDDRRLSNVSKAVQEALLSILKIPAEDFFQILHVQPSGTRSRRMASWPPCNTWEGRPASRSPSVRVRFDPVPRVDGIEASGDPLTAVRADIYPRSGRRRRGRLRRREALIGRKGTHLFVNGHTSADDRKETVQMTCKIERQADEHHTTLRLIGYLQAAHLEALQANMESNGPRIVLDLDEVTLVDVEVVRFLGRCEQAGTALLHCPPYIREWIAREQRP